MKSITGNPRFDSRLGALFRTSAAATACLAAGCSSARAPLPGPCTGPSPAPSATAEKTSSGGWVSGRDTAEPAKDWRFRWDWESSRCLLDHGCPFAPTAIPDCPDVDLTTDWEHKVGETVSLRGRLEAAPGFTTQKACNVGDVCCNTTYGGMMIRVGQFGIMLKDQDNPQAFACEGDSSMICCGFDSIGSEVVMQGQLARIEALELRAGGLAPNGGFLLRDVKVCRVPIGANPWRPWRKE